MDETLAGVVTGAVTIASRDVQLNGVAVEAGKWLGLAEGEAVAGGETFDDAARAVLETLLGEPRGVLTLLTGEDAPALDGADRARRVRRTRTSSSTCTTAASRTTRSCWRPSDAAVRVALVEDNDVFRETLELAVRDARRGRGRRQRRRPATTRPSCARRVDAGRRADGLPHAGPERRRGDGSRARGRARRRRSSA